MLYRSFTDHPEQAKHTTKAYGAAIANFTVGLFTSIVAMLPSIPDEQLVPLSFADRRDIQRINEARGTAIYQGVHNGISSAFGVPDNDPESNTLETGLTAAMLLYGGVELAASKGPELFEGAARIFGTADRTAVTVFRVEGAGNARILINGAGKVTAQGDKMLFLNFGQANRAESFLARRLAQGYNDTIKTFEVPKAFVEDLRATSVFESEASSFPNAPLKVDLAYPDQFGLRAEQIQELNNIILPGSGR